MLTSNKIRVLIADDSAFMRKVLFSILSADPQMDIVGEARDGREAVNLAQSLHPDVITMDIMMPHMDGMQATEQIMSSNPRPIVVVSSESREGAEITLRTLELGAIDFVAKPSSGVDLDMNSVREELCRKVKMAAKVRVVRTAARSTAPSNGTGALGSTPGPSLIKSQRSETPLAAPERAATKPAARFPIIVVAASTGGPATLMRFVPQFARDFPAAVLLVQHMPGSFSGQFTRQLAEVAAIRVKDAEAGEIVQSGTFYVCPGSHHLRISPTGRVTLDDGPRIGGYRPCADLTLETVASFAGSMGIGVVLTGMGNDAAKGVQMVKAAGGHVIAQDEATSVIFGMPEEAIKTGAVDQVLPIDAIYTAIEKRVLYVFGAARVGAL